MTDLRVARLAELERGCLHRVDIDGIALCLARLDDGSVHAIGDRCTHENFSLSEGELLGTEIECPQHSSRFDVTTGIPTGLPAVVPARIFPTTLRNGDVYVEIPEDSDAADARPGRGA
jgi:3-phenylpropionate/trans-cinnamate dioxygenase ferredoxin subunit